MDHRDLYGGTTVEKKIFFYTVKLAAYLLTLIYDVHQEIHPPGLCCIRKDPLFWKKWISIILGTMLYMLTC